MSTSPLVFDPYVVNNVQGTRFLDVGCGHGKWGYLLKKYADPPSQPRYVVGVDVFEPHVKALQAEGIYDEVHAADALHLPFEDKSFDTVIACEIIEHLELEHGPALIAELQRVARQCVIVSTPNYTFLRGGGETLDGFNPHEAHKCVYTLKSFRALGFTQVIGVGNLKLRPWRLARLLSGLGLRFPALSNYLMGYWYADGTKRLLYSE